MGVIEPVSIDEVGPRRPGRPHSDRIAELASAIEGARDAGRVTVRVELDDEEWFGSHGSALFRSRARAAGEQAGVQVVSRVVGRTGEIVLKSGE